MLMKTNYPCTEKNQINIQIRLKQIEIYLMGSLIHYKNTENIQESNDNKQECFSGNFACQKKETITIKEDAEKPEREIIISEKIR